MVLIKIVSLSYCQDVRVDINNQEISTEEKCPYRINGICSTEDIGGVDVTIQKESYAAVAIFTNYNTFPVTVLYVISSKYPNIPDRTGSIVFAVNGEKKVVIKQEISDPITNFWLQGIIVRPLKTK